MRKTVSIYNCVSWFDWVAGVFGNGLQQWPLWEASRSFSGSKSDPPLAKAESISDGGRSSVIMYLRRGTWEGDWGVRRHYRKDTHVNTEVSGKKEEEAGEICRSSICIPCIPWWGSRAAPTAPMEVTSWVEIHLWLKPYVIEECIL